MQPHFIHSVARKTDFDRKRGLPTGMKCAKIGGVVLESRFDQVDVGQAEVLNET